MSIKEFGAFLEFAPGKEGMVHINKIAKERINHVEDVLTLGDNKVKVGYALARIRWEESASPSKMFRRSIKQSCTGNCITEMKCLFYGFA